MADHVYDMFIGPYLPGFCATYPEIELEFAISDALTNLIHEGLHAGFRIGDRIAQDMVASRLTPPLPLAVLGSPAYFDRHGIPDTPRELLVHNCIRYRFHSSGRIAPWEFQGPEGAYSVDVRGQLINNTLPASIDLARQGLGLAYTFRDYAERELRSGQLLQVLEPYLSATPGIFIYFPREYRTMMPLRLFIDHLREHLAEQLRR